MSAAMLVMDISIALIAASGLAVNVTPTARVEPTVSGATIMNWRPVSVARIVSRNLK